MFSYSSDMSEFLSAVFFLSNLMLKKIQLLLVAYSYQVYFPCCYRTYVFGNFLQQQSMHKILL